MAMKWAMGMGREGSVAGESGRKGRYMGELEE